MAKQKIKGMQKIVDQDYRFVWMNKQREAAPKQVEENNVSVWGSEKKFSDQWKPRSRTEQDWP